MVRVTRNIHKKVCCRIKLKERGTIISQKEIAKMKEKITGAVKESNSLAQVRDSLFGVFREYRLAGYNRIGYVSGAITADGKENIPKNIARLGRFTEQIRT